MRHDYWAFLSDQQKREDVLASQYAILFHTLYPNVYDWLNEELDEELESLNGRYAAEREY